MTRVRPYPGRWRTGLLLPLLAALLLVGPAHSAETNYWLKPEKVAPNTYVFIGLMEHFNFGNGGNIVNIAAITTDAGIVLIDTGPSRLYAEQLKAALAKLSDKPVVLAVNTHLHPDHFLGNQIFSDAPIAALPATVEGIKRDGEAFSDNAYLLIGHWMKGTAVVPPSEVLEPGIRDIGGHRLHFLSLTGHTDGDMAIYDETTGVLFAGDLIFYQRALTTPHADVDGWLASLDVLQKLNAEVTVPGHGPVHAGTAGIDQTRKHLEWLQAHLSQAASAGLAEAEVLYLPLPKWVQALSVGREEYQRSVSHLYGDIERAALGNPISSHGR